MQETELAELEAYLVQVISFAWVWQVICWLPAFLNWLQERHDTLLYIWLKAVYKFQPFLAKAVEHLHKCASTEKDTFY